MARGGEHSVDSLWLEPPLFDFPHQLGLGLRRIESRPVRSRLAHGPVAVGGGKDAGGLIECRPARAAVVAGAVEPFVVRAGQHPDRSELLDCANARSVK